jgi:hypothetical protein
LDRSIIFYDETGLFEGALDFMPSAEVLQKLNDDAASMRTKHSARELERSRLSEFREHVS